MEQIRTRVEGVITENQRQESVGKKTQITQVVEETVRSSVDMTVGGTIVRERWYNQKKKTYYALVVLNRQDAAKRLKTKLDDIDNSVESSIQQAQAAQQRGEVFSVLRGYFDAAARLAASETIREVYQVILPLADAALNEVEPPTPPPSLSSITAAVDALLGSLRLETIAGDRQPMKTLQSIAPLIARVSVTKEQLTIPAINVPVTFTFEAGQGNLTTRVMTGTDGLVACQVYRAVPETDSLCVVSAILDVSDLAQDFTDPFITNWLNRLRRIKTSFTLVQHELTLDQMIAELAAELTTSLPNNLTVVIGSCTYQNTQIIGEFGEYLSNQLRGELVKSGICTVATRHSSPPSIPQSPQIRPVAPHLFVVREVGRAGTHRDPPAVADLLQRPHRRREIEQLAFP